MPKLYPAQPIKPMLQVQPPQQANPLGGRPIMRNMGTEPPQGFLGNPQQRPKLPKQTLLTSSPGINDVIQNAVNAPKIASLDLSRMKDAITSLAIRPAPLSIKKALGF